MANINTSREEKKPEFFGEFDIDPVLLDLCLSDYLWWEDLDSAYTDTSAFPAIILSGYRSFSGDERWLEIEGGFSQDTGIFDGRRLQTADALDKRASASPCLSPVISP